MDTQHIYIIIGILMLIILILLRFAILNWYKKRQTVRKMKMGRKMELKAKKVLSRNGFKKIRYQENVYYTMKVDGKDLKICCIPDYLAEKKGKKCVIEVKWGVSAPKIGNSATRRQLLEYQYAIQPDALFLLDIGKQTIKEIQF